MYHIKQDKRATKSADLIAEGLARCLEKKEYAEISITDVCNEVGVARSTFYRLFDVMEDILAYQYDSLFEQCIQNFLVSGKQEPYLKMLFSFLLENRAIVTTIVKSGKPEILSEVTRRKELMLTSLTQSDPGAQLLLYVTPMLNYIAVGVLTTWVDHGCKESPAELYEKLKKALLYIYNNA